MDAVALLIIVIGIVGYLLLSNNPIWRNVFLHVFGFGLGMLAGGIWAMTVVAGALK